MEKCIKIDTHYTRSINLERDANSKDVINAYIPTSRAIQTLDRVSNSFHQGEAPRAWSLVGPYGSGKSSFAIFLSHLLGVNNDVSTQVANKKLSNTSKTTTQVFEEHLGESAGYLHIFLTGSPESLSKRFVSALHLAVSDFWIDKTDKTPQIITQLNDISGEVTTTQIMDLLVQLQKDLSDPEINGKGILIVIDELGKFLEYEARHAGVNDIYLLQALAEYACKGQAINIIFVVLMHQAFEQYSKGLGETLRNEWLKVQGRFESIPYIESTEQSLRVLTATFRNDLTQQQLSTIKKQTDKVSSTLNKLNALPGQLSEQAASSLFTKCYPLHPFSALILPVLCQKVAQNERTMFSYLGSHEPFGFKDSVKKITKVNEWILPWQIFEYFIQNQPNATTDHLTYRRWVEVFTAVDRLGDADENQVHLLKTIGLFNIIGIQDGLKASKEIIELCCPKKNDVKKAITELTKNSFINYRQYSSEYRVWQGSDFDLDTAIQEKSQQVGRFNLAETLSIRQSLLPIVARKHSIQTGTLRYFELSYSDSESFEKASQNFTQPKIIFYLAESKYDVELFTQMHKEDCSPLNIYVLCENGQLYRENVLDVLSLERIQTETQELNSDPVAQREVKDRLSSAILLQNKLLQDLCDKPENNSWYWKNKKVEQKNKKDLQKLLSIILESVYYAAPVIKNELINREKPSAQANAARNKLAVALTLKSDQEDLGIEKFPAEKGIYRALIKATGLHKKIEDKWQLTPPTKEDKYNLYPAWHRIELFFEETENVALSIDTLDAILMAPPYGIKAGVLPLLYLIAYLYNQDEIALYEEGLYTPYLTSEHAERFIRKPGDFKFQRFRIQGMRASIFKEYQNALFVNAKSEQNVLAIVRPLAKFINDLPEYTQKTKRISKQAQQLRECLALSKSPEKLLFEDIPKACGFELSKIQEKNTEGFSEKFTTLLRELKHTFPNLVSEQQQLLCQAINIDPNTKLDELRTIIRSRTDGLAKYAVDRDEEGLKALINRLADIKDNDEAWFNKIQLFLSRKPIEKWQDKDRDLAEFRLIDLARRLNDFERLRLLENKSIKGNVKDFEVLLLRTVKPGVLEHDEVICLDTKTKKAISTATQKLKECLASELPDDKLKLAALAELVDGFFTENQQSVLESKKIK